MRSFDDSSLYSLTLPAASPSVYHWQAGTTSSPGYRSPAPIIDTGRNRLYDRWGSEFTSHETVHHAAKEFARGDVTTNIVEGMFGVIKRGKVGIYQHCGEQHPQRYLDEFAFRWNNCSKLEIEDEERARVAAYGMNDKRLTYRWTEAG
jgi:hypothetical protein